MRHYDPEPGRIMLIIVEGTNSLPTVRNFVKLKRINSATRVNTLFTEGNFIVATPVGISMSSPRPLGDDPAQLRQRAEDARREADLATDPIDRDTLIGIANAYEKLAAIAEAKPAPKHEL